MNNILLISNLILTSIMFVIVCLMANGSEKYLIKISQNVVGLYGYVEYEKNAFECNELYESAIKIVRNTKEVEKVRNEYKKCMDKAFSIKIHREESWSVY